VRGIIKRGGAKFAPNPAFLSVFYAFQNDLECKRVDFRGEKYGFYPGKKYQLDVKRF
jgi:hypothetical protein